uniref:Conotoxin superfamily M n=1 Tax=Conus ermineus TaxID=55423 RepID=A0A346CJ32_CONER|nr:conotoxin precursor superfamily M [Conus ermineus]
MMSKLGVLLTICLLLFPITALLMDGDQPADRPAERTEDDISSDYIPCCSWPCPRYSNGKLVCFCCLG